jgi:hypothetical protein
MVGDWAIHLRSLQKPLKEWPLSDEIQFISLLPRGRPPFLVPETLFSALSVHPRKSEISVPVDKLLKTLELKTKEDT